jgi:hypothetical protein
VSGSVTTCDLCKRYTIECKIFTFRCFYLYQVKIPSQLHPPVAGTKNQIMGNLLYIIAVILVVAWAIGFLGLHAGGLIHLLLVIALVAVLIRIIQGRKVL